VHLSIVRNRAAIRTSLIECLPVSDARGLETADRSLYTGRFGQAGSPGLSIVESSRGLELVMPGAPADSATLLAPAGNDSFQLAGGGATLRFSRDARGNVVALRLAGGLELERHPDEHPPDYAVVPHRAHDAATLDAFEQLYQRDVAVGDGRLVDYDLAAPRSEFLDWLCTSKKLLVHGSNTHDLAVLLPRRKSLALLQQQNDSAVSACGDGLWAMAYAILDRTRIRGAFHNTVIPFSAPSGRGRLYHLSIAREALEQSPPPFVEGTVYLLSRAGFSRLSGPPPLHLEWWCPSEARPLARLRVAPGDFALLHSIRGHDGRPARRFLELRDAMLREAREVTHLPDGYTLIFEPRPALLRDVFALCESLRRAFSWIDLRVHAPPPPAPVELTLRGSSGLRDVLDPVIQTMRASR
jgi:hypothetical protein